MSHLDNYDCDVHIYVFCTDNDFNDFSVKSWMVFNA